MSIIPKLKIPSFKMADLGFGGVLDNVIKSLKDPVGFTSNTLGSASNVVGKVAEKAGSKVEQGVKQGVNQLAKSAGEVAGGAVKSAFSGVLSKLGLGNLGSIRKVMLYIGIAAAVVLGIYVALKLQASFKR